MEAVVHSCFHPEQRLEYTKHFRVKRQHVKVSRVHKAVVERIFAASYDIKFDV
jgi:hypothetical protein